MAYGSGGGSGGSGGSGTGADAPGITFRGFSSRADRQNFKVYDFECAKQDLLNRLSVRKGERLENPEFGTIIYDCIFEPFTDDLKEAIVELGYLSAEDFDVLINPADMIKPSKK